jgi:hypothetical protein
LLIGVTVVIAVAAVTFYRGEKRWKAEAQRNAKNVEVLSGQVANYAVRDSLQAASISRLKFTLDEYKKYRAKDLSLIEDMKIDIKRLEEVTNINTTKEIIKTIPAERIDTTIKAHYIDQWHDIEISVEKDSISYTLHVNDSVLIAVHVIPKKFLWFKWGCKDVKIDAISKNPYTTNVGIENVFIR